MASMSASLRRQKKMMVFLAMRGKMVSTSSALQRSREFAAILTYSTPIIYTFLVQCRKNARQSKMRRI